MFLILFISVFVLMITWILLSPLSLDIDTRIPAASFGWKGFGNAVIIYQEEEWWIRFRIFFFRKELNLSTMKRKPKNETTKKVKHKREKMNSRKMLMKGMRILKTFRATQWRISLDTGDNVYNAWLYPLNFVVGTEHCNVNFYGENYLVLNLKNNMGRIFYAWFR